MQSQAMGSLKNYQLAYSSFIHPFGKVLPIEYTCETLNDFVKNFSFKLPQKYDLLNEQTNISPEAFLQNIVAKYTNHDKITHQLGFIEAFEQLYDISDSLSVMSKRLKMILTEFERILEHLTWFYELFKQTGISFFNAFKNFINNLRNFENQFFKVHPRDLSRCIEIGKTHLQWEETESHRLLTLLNEKIEQFIFLKNKILASYKLKEIYYAVGMMDTNTTLKTGTVGPIARASMVDQDLRIDDPYFDYLSFEFKIAQSMDQDLYGLVKVLLNEIIVSFSLIQSILEKDFQPKPENVLSEVELDQSGQVSVRLETSKGPTIYSLECLENMSVAGYGLSTAGMANLYSLETRLKGVPVAHINRIIHAYNITELTLFRI